MSEPLQWTDHDNGWGRRWYADGPYQNDQRVYGKSEWIADEYGNLSLRWLWNSESWQILRTWASVDQSPELLAAAQVVAQQLHNVLTQDGLILEGDCLAILRQSS